MNARRISIIGSAGAGKSTFAVRLGTLLELPVIHLDAHYWRPNWISPPRDEWRAQLQQLFQGEDWIMDGNYNNTLPERIAASDAVILLAFPRRICLYRVCKRALKYWGRSRPDLNAGCREHLPDRQFLRWIWNYPVVNLPVTMQLLRDVEAEKEVVILRSNRDVERFLRTLDAGSGLNQSGKV
ncbi:MAG: hypothetical protein GKR89_31480 [Candidatus Latescibacteria bacterium]|nr:hypothetical protein [Candidatus Latescibacterota bacterium]